MEYVREPYSSSRSAASWIRVFSRAWVQMGWFSTPMDRRFTGQDPECHAVSSGETMHATRPVSTT